MRKKSLYALVGQRRICFGEDIFSSVKIEFVQFSYKKKELENIAKQLNDCHYYNICWIVEEVS